MTSNMHHYLALFITLTSLTVATAAQQTSNDTVADEELNKELQDLYKNMELLKDLEARAEGDREARALLKKVSFLTGLKLGSVLQSSGTLAASNSFRVFGKVINSALSISYGNVEDSFVKLPQVVDTNAATNVQTSSLSRERVDRSKSTPVPESAEELPYNPNVPHPGPAIKTTPDPLNQIRSHFINQHNHHVQRANQKFFKTAFQPTVNSDL